MSQPAAAPPAASTEPATSPALTPPPGNPRFALFDSLRAIAALGVLVFHVAAVTAFLDKPVLGDALVILGPNGLILFFTISGFLLYRPFVAGRLGMAPNISTARYLRRRVLRIVPAYWTALTLLAIFPGLVGVFTGDWWRYYFFLQLYSEETVGGGLAVAWSLCVEVSFYVLLPVWAACIGRLAARFGPEAWLRTELMPLGVAAAAAVVVQVLAQRNVISDLVATSLAGQLVWFCVGMSLAVASVAVQRQGGGRAVELVAARPGLCWAGAAAAFVGVVAVTDTDGLAGIIRALAEEHPIPQTLAAIFLSAVLTYLLVLPAVFGEGAGGLPRRILASKVLTWLGVISYGIFLWHLPVAEYLGWPDDVPAGGLDLAAKLPGPATLILLALTLAVTCVFAAASYYLIELPFLRLKEAEGVRARPEAGERRVPLPGTRTLWLVVGAITALGLVLRLPSLSDSLFGDELAAYFVVTDNSLGRLLDLVESDLEITPPLFFVLARFAQEVGDPVQALRWVPLLSGLAAIPLTYVLGRRLLDQRAALVAAAIMALSPFLIFYSTEARPYALLMLLCLASTLALVRAVEDGGIRWWALYAVCTCAAMYTHYTAAFLLAAQAVWALVCHREHWRALIAANAAAALAWLPWWSSYRADQGSPGAHQIEYLQPFGLDAVKTDVLHWAISHPSTAFSVREMPGDVALALLGGGLLGGLAALLAEWLRAGTALPRPPARVALVLVLALAAPVLAALYSVVGVSVYLPRNLIASSPGLALALALVVTAPRVAIGRVAATGLLLAGFAVGAVKMMGDARRPDYEAVAAFLAARSDAPVIVNASLPSPGPLTSLDVALAPGAPRPAVGPLRLGRPSLDAEWAADQPGGPGTYDPLPEPSIEAVARQAVRRAHGRRIVLVQVTPFRPDAFLKALPRPHRVVATRTWPALFGSADVAAYVLEPR